MAAQQTGRVLLIGADHSYFTGKALAYMRYKKIPHARIASSTDVFMQVILPKVGWPVIPVAVVPEKASDGIAATLETGRVIQDTACIMDHFEESVPERPVHPRHPLQRAVSDMMEILGDQWLTMAAMHYRWSFPEQQGFLKHEWGKSMSPRVHGSGSQEERAQLSKLVDASMTKFAGFLPALGVTPETIPAIESSYLRFLDAFNAHLQTQPFLLGAAPCAGDFGLYGPLGKHLSRDPVPAKELKLRAPYVHDWIDRMSDVGSFEDLEALKRQEAAGAGRGDGPFPADGSVPDTTAPLVELFLDEHWPILRDTIDIFEKFVPKFNAEHAGEEIPRSLGPHPFAVGGVKGTRMAQSFDVWKAQRLLGSVAAASSQLESLPLARDMLACAQRAAAGPWVRKETAKPNRRSTLFLASKL